MSMPFIDLKAQYRRLKAEIDAGIAGVLEHGQYIGGPEVGKLEQALAEYSGVRHCVACGNGTDALSLVLMAYDIGPGDAVFCPSFTFTATAEVVLALRASPVFVEVDPVTFNIDPQDLARAIRRVKEEGRLTPRMIIAVDLFGQPADYRDILPIARAEGLVVMADAAQAFGGSLDGKRVGGLTTVTTTSFFPAKPLGCYGDGGAVFTDDSGLAEALRSLRNHGQGQQRYDTVRVGMNSRLDSIQAAILQVKLKAFPEELEARQAAAEAYTEALGDAVITPTVMEGMTSAWAQYTVKSEHRDALVAALKDQGIPTAIYYPRPMHRQPAYAAWAEGWHLPVSDRLCTHVFSLPMHPDLTRVEIQRVAGAVHGALERIAA